MSVTCSYCYERGHNRLGCPKRKKHCEENPDSYEAHAMKGEKEGRMRAVAKRSCTYCETQGHNRRSCQTLKDDKALVLKKNKEYRNHFIEKLSANGLGPGALVTYGAHEVHSSRRNDESIWDKNVTMVLASICWTELDFLQAPVIQPNGEMMQNSYRFIGRRLVQGRVLKTMGWNHESEESTPYWGRYRLEPAQNSLQTLTAYDVSCIMPDELPVSFERNGGQGDMKILAPSFRKWTLPEKYENKLTSNLISVFNFEPKANATSYEKVQLAPAGTGAWLYPDRDRCVKAWEEWQKKRREA